MTHTHRPLKYFRLVGRFEETRDLLREVESKPDLFEVDASRQQRLQVQRETRSIPVRIKQRRADLPEQRDRDVLGARWSPWADRLPRLRAFLEAVAERQGALLGRVRVVNLPAGQRVYPHIDRGDYYRQYERHHLVLRSTDGSWLKSGGEDVRMRDGELWWFDNRQVHEALNDGGHDRIHVIFDLLPRERAHLLDAPAAPAASACGAQAPMLPPGVHRLQWPGGLPCRLIVPSAPTDAVPLVAVHGMLRDVDAQVAALVERAEALGRFVIVPLFAERAFPQYRLGRCPRQADAVLLRTLREFGLRLGLDVRRVDLAGFSAGGQFAHRFAMLYPNRVRRLVIAAAGWYTMPDMQRDLAFPVGLAGCDLRAKVMHANLKAYLGLPITVVVGDGDAVADATTRREPLLDLVQGTHRVERAQRYVAAITEAGVLMNQRTDIRLDVLAGAGHDFAECAGRGLARLLLPSPDEGRAVPAPASRHGRLVTQALAA
jgi:dienelactone hydrolase